MRRATKTESLHIICVFLLSQHAFYNFAAAQLPSGQSSEIEKVPKVVIVGDSIRLSYGRIVTERLKSKAQVISSNANGGDSNSVLRNLDKWVLSHQPQLVHFNCGIHDTKRFKETGKFQVSPKQYEANLRKIVSLIRQKTSATIVFATTTPILDTRAAKVRAGRNYELLNSSVEQYNKIATRVMKELKVPVNDVHSTLAKPKSPHTTESLIGSDGVHLTRAAQQLLGEHIATMIEQQLKARDQK